MIQSHKWKGIKLDTPATYRIRVQGRLYSSWSAWPGGVKLVVLQHILTHRDKIPIFN